MSKLYELTHNENELLALLQNFTEDQDSEMYEAIQEQLEFTRDDIDHTVDRITKMISECDAHADSREKESDRLANSARIFRNKSKRLANYLKYCFERDGTRSVKTETHEVALIKQGGKPALDIDESTLPPAYFKAVQTIKIDRQKIWDDIKQTGDEIPGVRICERGYRLRISK